MWRRAIWPLSEAGVMGRRPPSLGSLFSASSPDPITPPRAPLSLLIFLKPGVMDTWIKTQKNLGLGSDTETQGWGKSLFPLWVFLFLSEKAERLSELLSEFPARDFL